MKQVNLENETINLYHSVSWKGIFSRWRFIVAPYIAVEKHIPKEGSVLELGCGEGIFTNYVGLCSQKRTVTGLEISEERIREADHGLKNVSFKQQDITRGNIPYSNTYVMFHVLHHLFSYSDQERVIEKIVKSMKKGSRILIVEVNADLSLKLLVAYLFDLFIVPFVFEKKLYAPVYFRKKKDWVKLLTENGLSVRTVSVEKNMPFPHVLFICKK